MKSGQWMLHQRPDHPVLVRLVDMTSPQTLQIETWLPNRGAWSPHAIEAAIESLSGDPEQLLAHLVLLSEHGAAPPTPWHIQTNQSSEVEAHLARGPNPVPWETTRLLVVEVPPRNFDCHSYDTCLDMAIEALWTSFSCQKCQMARVKPKPEILGTPEDVSRMLSSFIDTDRGNRLKK